MSVRAEAEPTLNFDEVEQRRQILSHEDQASFVVRRKRAEAAAWIKRRENHSKRRDLRAYFTDTLEAISDLGQVPEPLESSKIHVFVGAVADAVKVRHDHPEDAGGVIVPLLALDPGSDVDLFTDELAFDVLSDMPGVMACSDSIMNADATHCFSLHVTNGDNSYDRFRVVRAETADDQGEKQLAYSLYIDTLRA